jgi:hypothetical protein
MKMSRSVSTTLMRQIQKKINSSINRDLNTIQTL